MFLPRLLTDRLLAMTRAFPVVVVSGARQVGKSTLITHAFPAADCVVLDPVVDIGNARQDPELFLDNYPSSPLLIDEIQYAPELVAAIKRRVDRGHAAGQFVLTGSQQWEVMKSLAESLAGRAAFLDLEGFCLAELTGNSGWLQSWIEDPRGFASRRHRIERLPHTLYELLWRGFLPMATQLPTDMIGSFHEAYLRTYIERDVRLLADVNEWQTFTRFVRLVAALTAQEINYSQLGRDIGISPQTARRWLSLLQATFQWFEVSAFSGNTVKRVSGKPKGHFADTGLVCSAQVVSSPVTLGGHPLLGALFETAVAGEIRKQAAVMAPRPAMYHWRSAGGAEVDLILERDGKLFPIEIKVKTRPSAGDTRGMRAFRASYPGLEIQPGLVITAGERMFRLSENDYAMPWNLSG